ncbi:phospholipase D-like domain-containing protein [Salsuginibacillus kocurii]|uniref:phospholipase D-like domain-containing protein n=1 Tax=Salsuginibacillus kocurii TaxID=427078 RepID=UPI000376E1C7|nr:phospholipase D-like domain-containing protein [Salsuginibacillus kocurii]
MIKRLLLLICSIYSLAILFHRFKPLPRGLNFTSIVRSDSEVNFLQDVTYGRRGERLQEQQIMQKIEMEIERAQQFILIDMFLYNDWHDNTRLFPSVAEQLTRRLVQKKKNYPRMPIIVISDRINTAYGSVESPYFSELTKAGIQVILSDVSQLRDSNALYAPFFSGVLKHLPMFNRYFLPNPLSFDDSRMALRSWGELLLFKANHRKVVINEQAGVISSANPHDASAFHSNIGFHVKGIIIKDLLKAEQAVAKMSGSDLSWLSVEKPLTEEKKKNVAVQAKIVTEKAIKRTLLKEIRAAAKGSLIWVGAFYLSEQMVIEELKRAARRGAEIRLILDMNEEAFGKRKGGIPNRVAAYDLHSLAPGIQIKWYVTAGEQYHAKLAYFDHGNRVAALGGSANFTRRNLDNLNLELDVYISGKREEQVFIDMDNYFARLWNNDDGRYTLPYEALRPPAKWQRLLSYLQEKSGLSTF